MNRINETKQLNEAVRKEKARQEARSAQIQKDREAKKKREFEELMAIVSAKIEKLPPEEREKMAEKTKSRPARKPRESFVISGEEWLPGGSRETRDDVSENASEDSSLGVGEGPFFMDAYEFGDGERLFGMGEEGKYGGSRGSTRQYNSSRGSDRRGHPDR